MARTFFARATLALGLAVTACNGSGNGTHDAAMDASDVPDATADAGPLAPILQLPSGPPEHIAGLQGNVEVVIDTHGWPHIYASNLTDAIMVEGILVARDRMPQMDLIRRLASGTLADAFGAIAPSIINQDLAARVVGLRRVAQQVWDMMPDGRTKTALLAYSAGINEYLGEIRIGARQTPPGTDLVVNTGTPDWTPVDSLTVAWYQNFALSYDVDTEINLTNGRDASNQHFDMADPVMHPDLAARHGFFWDMNRFASPSTATAVPNFYAGRMGQYRPSGRAPSIPNPLVTNTQAFRDAIRDMRSLIAPRDRGSNNWVVSARASATGHAMLANDPHLSLTSPPVWWGVHLTITEGPDAVDVAGVSFPGIPGLVLGYNTHIAWGGTVANYDLTDVYLEQITPGTGGAPDTVRINGMQVPIQVIHEMVPNGSGGTVDARIEIVPGHGPILPTISNGQIQPRTGTTALSVRWTGFTPSQDLTAIMNLFYANTVADAMTALQQIHVVSQNWVIADVNGNWGYTTHTDVPIRAPGARTWDPMTNPNGTLPCLVLPGTGEAEWTGNLDDSMIPHATDSATQPWLNTSNNDQVGLSLDNNPINDAAYLSCGWAEGWRAEQVQNRLNALANHVSLADMQSIQNDHVLLVAGRYRPFLMAAFANLQDEWAHPGTHADLAAFAVSAMPHQAQLRDAAMRLMAWSLDSPSGQEYDASDATHADATATTIWQAWFDHVNSDALDDEANVVGTGRGDPVRGLLFLLEHPDQAHTLDPSTGQSSIWDDLTTTTVRETRDLILVRALDEAVTEIATHAGSSDPTMWQWGRFHFVRFTSIIPGPGAGLSIPPPGDAMFPNGFPRPGGIESVDPAWPDSRFPYLYGSGPSERFTVDMDPAGPHGFTVLPGGETFDPTSPHFRDDGDLWRVNQIHPIPRTVSEVVSAAESHLRFQPM